MAVQSGQLARVRRGFYASAQAPRPALEAVRVGGRLGGVSAAATYGLWAGTDSRTHVAVPRNASRLRPAGALPIVLHWVDAPTTAECWRVGPRDAVRQVVAWADTETAIACMDTAMTTWGWTSRYLFELFADRPAGERALALRARAGSGSGCESVVRQRLAAVGVVVEQQVKFGGVGHVDMLVRGPRLVIEVDGYEHHGTPRGFEEDRRRDAELVARGYVVVRLTYRQVTEYWPRCLVAIRGALAQLRKV